MKFLSFDQYEFESYEGEEYLAIISQLKSARGTDINNINVFFNRTKKYKEIEYWQQGTLNLYNLGKKKDLENQSIFQALMGLGEIAINPDQKLYIHHDEWNLQDILWEDYQSYYRAIWATTA